MADYYSILKKTIDGLPRNTPELRNAVYQKARTAIANQLRGMNPPPAEEAVSAQLQLLEDAILVVDMEYGGNPEVAQSPQSVAPVSQPPVPQPPTAEPPPAPAAEVQPEPVQPTVTVDEPAPIPPAEAVPTAPQQPQQDHSAEAVTPPVAAAPVVGATSEPPTVGMVPPPHTSVQGGPPPQPSLEQSAPPIPHASGAEGTHPYSDDEVDPFAPSKKSGLLRKIAVPLVVLALLGGSAYALWLNRDALQPIMTAILPGDDTSDNTSKDGEDPSLSSSEQAIDDDTAAQAQKESVKLGADGTETEVSPVNGESGTQTESQSASGSSADGQVVEQSGEVSDPSQGEQPLPIGEVAYLYEEGSAGTGASRTNAAVAWETKQVVLSDGLAPEPVIIGRMEVPEKDLTVDIEIKRNVDEALSASHIIEVRFDVPEGFSGSNIDNIARFVMKSSEEARGEPLVAVPVKVSDGFFLIALDNLQQAVDVNNRLMLESSWIDIPISYATGKRALITLEKGGTGERIFQETINDWQNR